MTSTTNPWNEVYKLAAGKRKQTAPTTTLRQKEGKLTANLRETLQCMIQELTPKDNQDDYNATHKQIEQQHKKQPTQLTIRSYLCRKSRTWWPAWEEKKRQGKMAYQAKCIRGW